MALPRNPVSTQGYTTVAADKITIVAATPIATAAASVGSLSTAQRVSIQADALSTSTVAVGSSVLQPILIALSGVQTFDISRLDRLYVAASSGTAIANVVAFG